MRQRRATPRFRHAAAAQLLYTDKRVSRFLGWTPFVIEIMDESHNTPALLVFAEPPRVRAHSRFGGQQVLAEVGILNPLADRGPAILSGHAGGSFPQRQTFPVSGGAGTVRTLGAKRRDVEFGGP